jgi:rubrerythrin
VNDSKKPWDIVPDPDLLRSFAHLEAVARTAVEKLLGPSPQKVELAEQNETYEMVYAEWLELRRRYSHDPEFEKNCPPPVPPAAVTLNEEHLDAWLQRQIQDRFLKHLDDVLLDMIGLERVTWGHGLRLKNGSSALGQALAAKAGAIAVQIANKWVDQYAARALEKASEGFDVDRTLRDFRYELEKAIKGEIEGRIKSIAADRANEISQDVLRSAIDRAMFDLYPVLRRAEAAKRLKGNDPLRTCANCGTTNSTSAQRCFSCGHPLP